MSYETGAPPPPEQLPGTTAATVDEVGPVRPAKGFDATTAILPGPPPGTSTYRLRAVETTSVEDPPAG